MASPRLALPAAAVILSGALGASYGFGATPSPSPTPTPSSSPTPTPTPTPTPSTSPTPGTALDRITARVHDALRGSTAGHLHYKITIAGLGGIAKHPNATSAPASNEKLFTTIALVEQVGAGYRYTTNVSGTSTPIGGTLDGDLVLVGSGDPTLTRHNLASLAGQLRSSGLRRVTGKLVVDDTRYSHQTRAPGWKHEFLPEESGAVDAFSVNNDNWRSSSTFLADPSRANAGLWRSALKSAGIHVLGGTHIGPAPTTLFPLASHSSRPLSKIVQMTLRESINYYAEMMLRELGYQYAGHGSRTTGINAIHHFADGQGLPIGRLEDGSGLSYRNRESPGIYRAWLSTLTRLPPAYRVIYSALPESCDPRGTLKYRMCRPTFMRRAVHAKTGTLTHITSLSGYAETRGGRFVTFSFLLSHVGSLTTGNNHVDAALRAIVRSRA
ncbi:MAG TPA: D-alanyl-D-alanine carboxypeptidase [Mycobacteriales bacterium]|nr:D-alanyl-D-alanine carboxypeptidase [Mycobacteriales bacterium]